MKFIREIGYCIYRSILSNGNRICANSQRQFKMSKVDNMISSEITDNYSVANGISNVFISRDFYVWYNFLLALFLSLSLILFLFFYLSICISTFDIGKNDSYRQKNLIIVLERTYFRAFIDWKKIAIFIATIPRRENMGGKYWSCAVSKLFVSVRCDFSFPLITLRHSPRVHEDISFFQEIFYLWILWSK